MIYGKDVALEYPTKDLYDSNIMLLAINAARYDYETGQDLIKEFNKLYGDFISPIQSDVDYWNRTTIEPVRDALNAMYQQGIDPTRSAEGRALIALIINNVPTAELNKRRASAKNAEEYLKNRAALLRAGKYNPDYEQFTLGGKSLETWNTDVDGPWMRTSPMEYMTLHDFVDPSLDNIKPYNLSKDEVEKEFGRTYDPRYQYMGVAPSRLEQALRTNLPGIAANPLYDYYKEQAKKDWMRLNPGQTPTEDLILDLFVKNAIIADNERVVHPIWDEDKYQLLELDFRHKLQLRAQDFKYDVALQNMRNSSPRGGGGNRSSSGSDGSEYSDENSLGTYTQLETEQNIKYQKNKLNFDSNALSELWKKFNKLSSTEKKVANGYAANYRIMNDPNASQKRKEEAKRYVKSIDIVYGKDSKFNDWKNQYLYRLNSGMNWNLENTTEGRAKGMPGTTTSLRTNSRDIFNKNNVVRGLNKEQQDDLNTLLNYSQSQKVKGGVTGVMNSDKDVADMVIAKMTGSRTYRWDLVPRYVSRLIKGKGFVISSQDQANRTYAAGLKNGKHANVIIERAWFDDPEIVAALDEKYSPEELAQFDIVKSNGGYYIPIASSYGHGQGASEVDFRSRKRRANEGLAASELAKQFVYSSYGL